MNHSDDIGLNVKHIFTGSTYKHILIVSIVGSVASTIGVWLLLDFIIYYRKKKKAWIEMQSIKSDTKILHIPSADTLTIAPNHMGPTISVSKRRKSSIQRVMTFIQTLDDECPQEVKKQRQHRLNSMSMFNPVCEEEFDMSAHRRGTPRRFSESNAMKRQHGGYKPSGSLILQHGLKRANAVSPSWSLKSKTPTISPNIDESAFMVDDVVSVEMRNDKKKREILKYERKRKKQGRKKGKRISSRRHLSLSSDSASELIKQDNKFYTM